MLSEVATQQGIKVPKCPVLSVFLITFCTDHENISTVEMKTTKPFSPIESINEIRNHHLSNPHLKSTVCKQTASQMSENAYFTIFAILNHWMKRLE